jgi:hypothetical protein
VLRERGNLLALVTSEKLDHPLVFLFVITLGVIAMMAIISWGLSSAHITGPLGLFKGGVVNS